MSWSEKYKIRYIQLIRIGRSSKGICDSCTHTQVIKSGHDRNNQRTGRPFLFWARFEPCQFTTNLVLFAIYHMYVLTGLTWRRADGILWMWVPSSGIQEWQVD